MTYIERITKLDSLDQFINGENQDDILLFLDKTYKDDKWSIICAVMHWFKVVRSYLDCEDILKENTLDYNWGNVYLYICAVDIITKGINDLNQKAFGFSFKSIDLYLEKHLNYLDEFYEKILKLIKKYKKRLLKK